MSLARCLRRAVRAAGPAPSALPFTSRLSFQSRNFSSLLSRPLVRPSLSMTSLESSTTTTTSSVLSPSTSAATSQPTTSLLLVRGAKRDTFNPSHRRRKRRHGFLARIKDRHGRKVILHRRLKKRTTLSH